MLKKRHRRSDRTEDYSKNSRQRIIRKNSLKLEVVFSEVSRFRSI